MSRSHTFVLAALRSTLAALLVCSLVAPAASAQSPKRGHKKKKAQSDDGDAAALKSGRLRMSAWVDLPIDPMYVGRQKAELTDSALRAKYGKNIIDGKGLIDDLSIVSTVTIKGTDDVAWHPMFLPGLPNKRAQYLKDVISIAHENGIQVLAGFEITDTGNAKGQRGQAFVKLMANADDDKLKAYAEKITKFLYDDNGLDFDGIGFDLEINGLNDKHAANVTKLYHYLAEDLAKRGNKLLTYATGLGVDRGNAVKEKTLGSFMAQPFSIAKGYSNIIARPMAYDVGLKEDALFAWHDNIAKYAMDAGLKPTQFQLGVKTLGNSAGNVTDAKLVAKRGREILKPKGAGLIIFAMSKSANWGKYKIYDAGLNGQ
jgi:hypothetical protein